MASKKILGLDLGTSSIGWSLIELDEELKQGKIEGIGSRIFEPPVEPKTEEPKNLKRRTKRGMRHLLARRAMRRDTLLRRLVKAGLLPSDAQVRKALMTAENPYRLRALGLDAPLTPYQLGRALFHMDERRGFLSNKKSAGGKDKKKENSETLEKISTLQNEIDLSNSRTLGEYLYRLQRQAEKQRGTATLRRRHTSRKMYETEFEAIWNSQKKHNPELTYGLKKLIHDTIFFQRPLRVQKGLVGLCTFFQWRAKDKNGKEFTTGKKRCMRAHPLYQRFRLLQDVNSVRINGEPLSADDRKILIKKLEQGKELSWDQVRKALSPLDERDIINLERESKKLKGLQTIQHMEKILGKNEWASMDERAREGVFEAITTIDDDEKNPVRIIGLLTQKFGLSREAAEKLANLELEAGYAPLSVKAIKMILPHLESGLVYMAALDAVAKELQNKDGISASERHFLAGARKMLGVSDVLTGRPKLPSAPIIRNPVVQRALNETRRVVNAIMAKYGVPDEIQVELARDLKLSRARKTDLIKEQYAAKKERDEAKKFFEERGRQASGDDVLKYRLWKECGAKCPYTGQTISEGQLLGVSGEVHIIPWIRSFDDGFNNKTLCFADENRTKGNQTPWEAYHRDEQRWGQILQNIHRLPNSKKNRFTMKELPQDLPTRYLNDTRYMSREARDYLRQICPTVRATKGGLTAKLRYFWGLNDVLREGEENPQNKKNREDHRHHAIDAAVIALTTSGALHRLSRANALEGRVHADNFQPPWDDFRKDVAAKVKTMIVSHRPSRKISGALHEETNYGKTVEAGRYVYRVPVEKLTLPMLGKIRDPKVREIIQRQVEIHGDPKNAASHCYFVSGSSSKIPIRKVRIVENKTEGALLPIRDDEGVPYRYAKFGNNHHIEIIENTTDGRWDGKVVTAAEAARRARIDKTNIVQKEHGPEWRFVMSLSQNETVMINEKGQTRFFRVQNIWESTVVVLREHFSANINDKSTRKMPVPNSLKNMNAGKVFISCLGEIRPTHD